MALIDVVDGQTKLACKRSPVDKTLLASSWAASPDQHRYRYGCFRGPTAPLAYATWRQVELRWDEEITITRTLAEGLSTGYTRSSNLPRRP